jgi:hypothetical protein
MLTYADECWHMLSPLEQSSLLPKGQDLYMAAYLNIYLNLYILLTDPLETAGMRTNPSETAGMRTNALESAGMRT